MTVTFRKASLNDLPVLVNLINCAYRNDGANSWTNEKQIVSGQRITLEQLKDGLKQSNFELWVMASHLPNVEIQGCIGLTLKGTSEEIGTFCIDPQLQNTGLGRQLLAFAEKYLNQYHAEVQTLEMDVLSVRPELIEFYERCGYFKTGKITPYPVNANVGQPLVNLHLIHLHKFNENDKK